MDVSAERQYTLADAYAFPEKDGHRYEIIDGVLFVSAAPRAFHEWSVGQVFAHLNDWTRVHGGWALPGGNVDLADDTHLEPDVIFLAPGRPLPDELAHTDPDLVVEVSSPSTRSYDTGIKRARYARSGVPESWFVDLDQQRIEVSRLEGDRWYGDPVILEVDDRLTSPSLPGFAVPVRDLVVLPTGGPT
ncbi:MAG: Uma2 family endonuclease [Nitriliruptor sp.]|uniref:Uma2 family endonuclease n=1 Tax=Nitriliruptor sp. TaxID=2448056 RepID=UPI0034A08593